MNLNFLQINLGRGREAQDLMVNNARQKNVDIILISEQYKKMDNKQWYQDSIGKASIYVRNSNLKINKIEENNENFVTIHCQGMRIYSCYFSPNMELSDFLNRLSRLEEHIKSGNTPVFIGGDFNSKSPEWQSDKLDKRGAAVSEMIASLDLIVLNRGNSPTFRRGESGTIIDITVASASLAAKTNKWEVLEDETLSDHQYIVSEINGVRSVYHESRTKSRWNTRKLNMEAIIEALERMKTSTSLSQLIDHTDLDIVVARLSEILTHVCNAGMPKNKTPCKSRKPAYWWNEEIASLRTRCLRAKRVATRKKGDNVSMNLYREARKDLKDAIKNSKRKSWDALCSEINNDPWGLPYRIVMKKLGNHNKIPGITNPAWAHTIVNTLFPRTERTETLHATVHLVREQDLFLQDEVMAICRKLKKGKAPGPDGVPNEIIAIVGKQWPGLFTSIFNTCLKMGVFPTAWKKQMLVLLRKADKPLDNPSSYRPLCLLDTCGKFLERLLVKRMEAELNSNGGFSSMQFGFVKKKSTLDAIREVVNIAKRAKEGKRFCAIVTLDIKNAFNTADWEVIRQNIRERNFSEYLIKMIDSYLNNRVLEYETDEGIMQYRVSAGVPQGSILGPFLWNLMYDGLLNLALPEGSALVGYADDVALVVDKPNPDLIEIVTNDSLGRINRWLRANHLQLAAAKTEAILITKRRSFNYPQLCVGGHVIQIKRSLRYLGMHLDGSISFNEHVKVVSEKALGTARILSQIMPNMRGPGQTTRKLIAGVAYAQMLYGAPILNDVMKKGSMNINKMEKVQRTSTIRVTSAYRTISTSAAAVLASIPPVELILEERSEVYNEMKSLTIVYSTLERNIIKKNARKRLYQKWQKSWNEDKNGRWTHKLIPDIEKWMERKHGEVNFFVTQALSGHGNFSKYLERFKIRQNGTCDMCGSPNDDAEHTIFECNFWVTPRCILNDFLGVNITAENMTTLMLEKEENWCKCSNFIEQILRTKKKYQEIRLLNP